MAETKIDLPQGTLDLIILGRLLPARRALRLDVWQTLRTE